MLDDLALWVALDLLGLDSHDLGGGERERDFVVVGEVVVVGELVDHLLDLLLLEAAHEP